MLNFRKVVGILSRIMAFSGDYDIGYPIGNTGWGHRKGEWVNAATETEAAWGALESSELGSCLKLHPVFASFSDVSFRPRCLAVQLLVLPFGFGNGKILMGATERVLANNVKSNNDWSGGGDRVGSVFLRQWMCMCSWKDNNRAWKDERPHSHCISPTESTGSSAASSFLYGFPLAETLTRDFPLSLSKVLWLKIILL